MVVMASKDVCFMKIVNNMMDEAILGWKGIKLWDN